MYLKVSCLYNPFNDTGLKVSCLYNPFNDTGLFLYPLKISEGQRFSDIFREYRKRLVAWDGIFTEGNKPLILADISL